MRAKLADRFAGLHEQRFVAPELAELADDDVEAGPVSRCFSAPAVHDQILRTLRDFGVEIVVEHAKSGLLNPAFAGERAATWRTDDAR